MAKDVEDLKLPGSQVKETFTNTEPTTLQHTRRQTGAAQLETFIPTGRGRS